MIKRVIPYPLIAIVTACLCIYLHHLANLAPSAHLAAKIHQDFKNLNLDKYNYPFNIYGSDTIRSNIGQNQYTECAVIKTLLVPNQHSLRDAVLPRTIEPREKERCQQLWEISTKIIKDGNNDSLETRALRSRYWWGARSIYAAGMRYFNLFELRELIRGLTVLVYLLLTIALCCYSKRAIAITLPLIVFGSQFSGLNFYSDVILGIPYLWAIFTALGTAVLLNFKKSDTALNYWLYLCGCISSYIWLLDGHIMLAFAWLAILAYISTEKAEVRLIGTITRVAKYISIYCIGFLSCYLLGQLAKGFYLGNKSVFGSITKSIETRTSSMQYGETEVDTGLLLDVAINIGYKTVGVFGHDLLWKIIILSSVLAGVLGLAIIALKFLRGDKRVWIGALVVILIGLSVVARYLALQNHTAIHAFFIGRYFFISMASMWMLLAVALFPIQPKRNLN